MAANENKMSRMQLTAKMEGGMSCPIIRDPVDF